MSTSLRSRRVEAEGTESTVMRISPLGPSLIGALLIAGYAPVAREPLQTGAPTAAGTGVIAGQVVDATSRRRPHELSGRTTGNTVVNFPGDASWIGELVPVLIERAGPNSVSGRVTAPPAGNSLESGATVGSA